MHCKQVRFFDSDVECCDCWVVRMCMCVFLGKGYFICVVVILLVLIKYVII